MTAIHQGLAQTKVGDFDTIHVITLAEHLWQQQPGLTPLPGTAMLHTSSCHNTHPRKLVQTDTCSETQSLTETPKEAMPIWQESL